MQKFELQISPRQIMLKADQFHIWLAILVSHPSFNLAQLWQRRRAAAVTCVIQQQDPDSY